MPIKDWPNRDKPREKMLAQGEQNLTDTELVAILLKTGSRGKTAIDIARELLTEHGNLQKLLQAPASSLIHKFGMGPAKYAALKAAVELGRRFLHQDLPKGALLNNSCVTQEFLATQLREHLNEVFACIFMDSHLHLLSFEKLFHGTIHSAAIYPREIVRRGLYHNAAKIILAHNHPSGQATPSLADKETTSMIQHAVQLVDIEVVDHIIIGRTENFSFADAGLI